ncbi:hypothetical protein FA95DRAFT_941363 [Auriscalpium vulgare]|uniref:Uncharacterized protein n=1 Tax=Auriscalpium vulgare TaxID=40419 RepID=A0ACB8SA76_9AGAM|nr:hypothetical protein FA95DRAFT_941363 [Auriscalpium vulgare]
MSTSATVGPENIVHVVAPILIGRLLNFFFYGILFVQVYLYYFYFPEDRKRVKCLVYGIFILETVQTAFAGNDLFYWLCKNFGNYAALDKWYLTTIDTPIFGSITTLVVQSFFSYRIQIIKKSLRWLSIIIFMISLLQVIGGVVGGIQGTVHPSVADAHRKESVILVYLWYAGDAVADTMIAVTMVYLFAVSRNQDFHYMNDVLTRLMRLTVETNVLSASVVILSLALYAGLPNHRYYFAPAAIISKLYANTLLVSLNNRISIRDMTRRRSHSKSLSRQLPDTLLRNLQQSIDSDNRRSESTELRFSIPAPEEQRRVFRPDWPEDIPERSSVIYLANLGENGLTPPPKAKA